MDINLKNTLTALVGRIKTFLQGNYVPSVNGQVPSQYLPSYVDDVIEGYYYNNSFYSDDSHTELIQAETGKIYVDITVENNAVKNESYRYTGGPNGTYIKISSPIDLTDNVTQGSHAALTSGGAYTKFQDYTPTANLAPVATSGDYDDLDNKPEIPAAQVQADWSQSDDEAVDFIKNKPSVDSELSTTSKNAVQNKKVTVELNKKLNSERFFELEEKALTIDGVKAGVTLSPVQISNAAYYPTTISGNTSQWKLAKSQDPTFFKIYDINGYEEVHLVASSRAAYILTNTTPEDFASKVASYTRDLTEYPESGADVGTNSEQADVQPRQGYTPYNLRLITNGKHYLIVYEGNATQGITVTTEAGYNPLTTSLLECDGNFKIVNQWVKKYELDNPVIDNNEILLDGLNLKIMGIPEGSQYVPILKIDDVVYERYTTAGDPNATRYIYRNVEDHSESITLRSAWYDSYSTLDLSNTSISSISHLELGNNEDVYTPLDVKYMPSTVLKQSDWKQSDWDQVGSNQMDFIKNKTHYRSFQSTLLTTEENPIVDTEQGNRILLTDLTPNDYDVIDSIVLRYNNNNIDYIRYKFIREASSYKYFGVNNLNGTYTQFIRLETDGNNVYLYPMNSVSFENKIVRVYGGKYNYKKLDDVYINDTIVRTSPFEIDNGSTVDLYPNHAKKALNAARINITTEGELSDRNNIWRAVITGNPAIIINCVGQTIKWNIDFATMTSGELYLMEITGNSTCGLFGTLININLENTALVPVGNPVSKNFTFDLTDTTNCYIVKKLIGLGDEIDGHTVTTDTHFAINFITISSSGTYQQQSNYSYISLVASDIDKYNNVNIDGVKNSPTDWEDIFAVPGATNPHFNQYGSDNKGKLYAIFLNRNQIDSNMPYAKLRTELPVVEADAYVPSGDWDAKIGEVFGSVETVCNYFWLRCRNYGVNEGNTISITVNFTLYEPLNS